MRGNHLYRSFGLLLIGCLIAYGLSKLLVTIGPVAGYSVKTFNPLSNLLDTTALASSLELSSTSTVKLTDTIDLTNPLDVLSSDTDNLADGKTLPPLDLSERLIDYSEGEGALRTLRAVLAESRSRAVHIAFAGDSFIEGDILVAPFRNALQKTYGGQGVGYVPITSLVARFRQSIHQRFEGAWQQIHANKSKSRSLFTLSETFTTAMGKASTTYTLANSPTSLSSADRVTLHYVSDSLPVAISYSINDSEIQTIDLPPSHGRLAEYLFPHTGVKRLQLATEGDSKTRFYGIYFDGTVGVSVDNYGLRGSLGTKLSALSTTLTSQLNLSRPYDLIILSYGLNVVSSEDNDDNYDWYYTGMSKAIEHIQRLYPHTVILLMSLSDRATLRDGDIYTLNGVERVLRIQQRLAQQYRLLFWNTHEAMSSLGGIKSFVDKGWAAKDYTHLSTAGGVQIATLLTSDLLGYDER